MATLIQNISVTVPGHGGMEAEIDVSWCDKFVGGFSPYPIDGAVDAIHKTAIRFMTPSTMREHDFLRSVIQEEIEKVVAGVR
jgi:hypothetical protein